MRNSCLCVLQFQMNWNKEEMDDEGMEGLGHNYFACLMGGFQQCCCSSERQEEAMLVACVCVHVHMHA